MWQDYVIALVQWGLLFALLPTILHKTHKPALWSSLLTGSLLAILSVTFFTLELWNASVSAFAAACGWVVLAIQRHRLNRRT